jgi:hypothetical protein
MGRELVFQTLEISRFQKSWTERAVHFNRARENASREIVERRWVDKHEALKCKRSTDAKHWAFEEPARQVLKNFPYQLGLSIEISPLS